MAKSPIAWAARFVLCGALGLTVSADAGRGIVLPMLLDFQPVVVPLDPTGDVQKQLLQFCVAHLLDLRRCHVLQDAVADVVRREKGGLSQPCRPTEKPLTPSFALVKNLLVAVDSAEQRASFRWLHDSPENIATDICGFLARSQAAVDVSTVGCVKPLATAITQSFQWLNAVPACDADAGRVRPSARLQLVRRSHLAERSGDVKTPAKTASDGGRQITITPLELSDVSTAKIVQSEGDALEDDENAARPGDRPIRITPMIDSRDASAAPRDDSLHSDSFVADAMVVLALFAIVMLAQWLSVLLIGQHKSLEIEEVSLRSGKTVVAPLELAPALPSMSDEQSSSPLSERSLHHALSITRRVHDSSVSRTALQRWRAAVRLREALTVETNPRLLGAFDRHDVNEHAAETDSPPPPPPSLETPASSSARRRVPSYSLVAMSLLMPPCSPMAASSPGDNRADPETPLARVTRLLEAESGAAELLDQFDAARRAAEHQNEAARRIQRVWRSRRTAGSSEKREKDTAKPGSSHRPPHRASQLLRQVRRLQSRFSSPREDLVGQSASSA